VSSLDPDLLLEIKNYIKRPPQSGKYEALKVRIIFEFQDSENECLKELLDGVEFGDQHPSRALRRLRDLTEGNMSDNFLKVLWMQRLPTAIIVGGKDQTLDDLAA